MAQHSAAQDSTTRHRTTQSSTAQHRAQCRFDHMTGSPSKGSQLLLLDSHRLRAAHLGRQYVATNDSSRRQQAWVLTGRFPSSSSLFSVAVANTCNTALCLRAGFDLPCLKWPSTHTCKKGFCQFSFSCAYKSSTSAGVLEAGQQCSCCSS